jgi:hypothetical protein
MVCVVCRRPDGKSLWLLRRASFSLLLLLLCIFSEERARQSQHKERVGFIESQSVSVEAAAARCVAAGKPPQQQRHEPLCSSAVSASCEVGGHEAGRSRRDSALCRIRQISTQDQEQKPAARQILRAQEGMDWTQIWYFSKPKLF